MPALEHVESWEAVPSTAAIKDEYVFPGVEALAEDLVKNSIPKRVNVILKLVEPRLRSEGMAFYHFLGPLSTAELECKLLRDKGLFVKFTPINVSCGTLMITLKEKDLVPPPRTEVPNLLSLHRAMGLN